MRTTKRIGRGAAGACAFLLALAPALAWAQVQVTGFRPECGSPGDLLLIEGQGFPTTTTPTVTIAGTPARLLRNGPNRILCRVAPGTPTGSATVEVDGVAAPGRYTVLASGSPVILRQSTRSAAPGQWVVLVGLRFGRQPAVTIGGISAQVRGRWRVVAAQVPNGVTGTVDVVVTNAAGQSNAACPGSLTVVPAGGSPTITNVTPTAAAPGDRITIEGQYLAPAGMLRIEWDDGAGTVLQARGISNGYDKVYSYVPPRAAAGSWTVTVFTRPAPASTSYTVGTAAAPQINALRPDSGPAGTRFAILGNNLLVWGSRPDVTFDGQSIPVLGFFRNPITGEDVLLSRVPGSATSGAHTVRVTVGGQNSNDATFTVTTPGGGSLTVRNMWPTSPPPFGPVPIRITGTGFGAPGNPQLSVGFDRGAGPVRMGRILWNNAWVIVVMPPGGRANPLPSGSYTVTVQNGAQSAVAGTYTVP